MSGRILVVDDDASIRETFEHHLARSGYQVRTAASAEEALAVVAEFEPALVITDIRMPGMDGLELLRQVRSAAEDIDVLLITAHEEMKTAIEAMKAGAYDYLVKPLDLDQIDILLKRCFRDRALHRRVRHLADEAAEPYSLERLVGRDQARYVCRGFDVALWSSKSGKVNNQFGHGYRCGLWRLVPWA